MWIEKSDYFLRVEKKFLNFQKISTHKEFDQAIFKELIIAVWNSLKTGEKVYWEMNKEDVLRPLNSTLSQDFENRAIYASKASTVGEVADLPQIPAMAASNLLSAFFLCPEIVEDVNLALSAYFKNKGTRAEDLVSAIYLSVSGLWLSEKEEKNAH